MKPPKPVKAWAILPKGEHRIVASNLLGSEPGPIRNDLYILPVLIVPADGYEVVAKEARE